MSLINDALKKISSKRSNTLEGLPLKPVMEERSRAAMLIPILLVVLVLGACGYGGWKWYSKRQAELTAEAAENAKKAAAAKAARESATANASPKVEVGENSTGAVGADEAMGTSVAATKAAEAEGSHEAAAVGATDAGQNGRAAGPGETASGAIKRQESFPALKLQAIYYRLDDPSVLINGRTLREGQQIEGARVGRIDRRTVQVEYNGQVKELSLK
jgi:hypothetical protein